MTWAPQVSRELALAEAAVSAVLRLTEEGATVPFLARYRKEATGGLDETQIRAIIAVATRIDALEKRREAILSALAEGGHSDDELNGLVKRAETRAELEDLYAPFKAKRRTRAQRAREQGLGPLAEAMWQQPAIAASELARQFVRSDNDVPDVEVALSGARDICVERLANATTLRQRTREAFWRGVAIKVSKTPKFREQVTKFDSQSGGLPRLGNVPSHRWLACVRGEQEGVLRLAFEFDSEPLQEWAIRQLPRSQHPSWTAQTDQWVREAFSRLILPAVKAEARRQLDEQAEATAIDVFATNLRELLLAPPLGARPVLGIDPGQRTGCKCALVDGGGRLLAHDTLFLVQGGAQRAKANTTLGSLLKKHAPAAVAVGNGTHGRETQQFVQAVLDELPKAERPFCVSVSETGASVYSASDVARREFPELDVSYRGAVNIARRLQDPLAELVKIDPKSIGVGQYQHDMDAVRLSCRLDEVVESCVNSVGVELNTASPELLARVAGVGPKLAERIVQHRRTHGRFQERKQLLAVKGLGAKGYEQAAGFLRITGGKNPLDATAVHPEHYAAVGRMAKSLNKSVPDLLRDTSVLTRLKAEDYARDGVGQFTFSDILDELKRPGRDPRSKFEAPSFDAALTKLEDVKVGMKLPGVVTNVAAFGAFVDIGVHQDGLVHVSRLGQGFVKDPTNVVKVGEHVRVEVLGVDLDRRRISLARLLA